MKAGKQFFIIRGKEREDTISFNDDFEAWQMLFSIVEDATPEKDELIEDLYRLRLRGLRLTRDGKFDFANFHVEGDGGNYRVVNPNDPQITKIKKSMYEKHGDDLVDAIQRASEFVKIPKRKSRSNVDFNSGTARNIKSREEKSVEVEIKPTDNSTQSVDSKSDDVPMYTATTEKIHREEHQDPFSFVARQLALKLRKKGKSDNEIIKLLKEVGFAEMDAYNSVVDLRYDDAKRMAKELKSQGKTETEIYEALIKAGAVKGSAFLFAYNTFPFDDERFTALIAR